MNRNRKYRMFIAVFTFVMVIGNIGAVKAQEVRKIILQGGTGQLGEYVQVKMKLQKPKDVTGIQCTIGYDPTKLLIENKDIRIGKALEKFIYDKNVIKEKAYLKFSAISLEELSAKAYTEVLSLDFKIKENVKEGVIPITLQYALITNKDNQEIKYSIQNTSITVKKEEIKEQEKENNQDDETDKTIPKEREVRSLTGKNIDKAIRHQSDICVINVSVPKGTKVLELKIKKDALEVLKDKKVKALQLNVNGIKLILKEDLVSNLEKQIDEELVLTLTDGGGKQDGIKIKMSEGKEKITNLKDSQIMIRLPYQKEKSQLEESIVMKYSDEDGKEGVVATSYFDAKRNEVVGQSRRLSNFVISYNPVEFKDIEGNTHEQAIRYLSARGVIHGMGNEQFAPRQYVTRGEFVKMLAKIADANTASYITSTFKDVSPDKWYMPCVAWASQNNIVNGIGEDLFDPEALITHEQMAAMVVKFMNVMQYEVPQQEGYRPFEDDKIVSEWAKQSVITLQRVNILRGKQGKLTPQDTVTRGETAALLTRLLKQINR